MPCVDPDDMAGNIKVYSFYIVLDHQSDIRLKYKLTSGPVFPNLSLGNALNLETFRKVFKRMMDGK